MQFSSKDKGRSCFKKGGGVIVKSIYIILFPNVVVHCIVRYTGVRIHSSPSSPSSDPTFGSLEILKFDDLLKLNATSFIICQQ